MIWRQIYLRPCDCCGRDVARVFPCADGWKVSCDMDAGGCGADVQAAASEALAVDRWNNVPSPAAQALVVAAARRAMA